MFFLGELMWFYLVGGAISSIWGMRPIRLSSKGYVSDRVVPVSLSTDDGGISFWSRSGTGFS